MSVTENRRLPEINGLRGIAILMVLYIHLFFNSVYNSDWKPLIWSDGLWSARWLLAGFLRHGWNGVNFFFVLSGFVLFAPYVSGARQFSSQNDYFGYYTRRFWRLMPLLFVSTALFLALTNSPEHHRIELLRQFLVIITGIFSFSRHYYFPPINGVLWSLGIELWFSLIFPFLAVWLLRTRSYIYIIAIYALAVATRLYGAQLFLTDWPNPFVNPVKDCLLGRLDDFVAGMAVCLLYYRVRGLAWFARPLFALLGIATIWAGFILWDLSDEHLLPGWVIAMANIPINVGFGCLMLYCLKAPSSWLAWLFRRSVLQACGVMCYSIYVWHYNIQARVVHEGGTFYQIGNYLVFLSIVATVSWLIIENANAKDISARLKKLVY